MEPTPLPPSLLADDPVAAGDGASPGDGPYEEFTPEEHARGQEAFWWTLSTLFRRRRFIIGLTTLAIIGSVVISLLLPLWYQAESRVLLPEGGGGAFSLVDQLAPGASAFLGGGGGEYTRYLSILTSRTVLDRTIERFDLEQVYEMADKPDPRGFTREMLQELTGFEVALDFDHMSVTALDQDPERAAAIVNFLVQELNREHIRLTAASARQTREYIEGRQGEALAMLDSARTDLAAFQELHGLIDIETQGAAFFSVLADARAEEARLEIEYETLRSQYGEDNPQTQALSAALAEGRAQRQRLEGGGEALLPVPLSQLPDVSRRYAMIYQEVLTQAKIIEAIQPMLEQARFEEERQAMAVQVIDEAVPPVRKAKPHRALIVVAATLSVFLLVCVFVLAQAWWRTNAASFAGRLGAG